MLGHFSSRLRPVLDVLATLAMLAASSLIIYKAYGNSTPTPSAPSVPSSTFKSDEPLTLDGVPLMGAPGARSVMIVYSDFQCPYCSMFARDTLPRIKAEYVDTGRLRVGFRHSPLERIHPLAVQAARASVCANSQGQFWQFHDDLFGIGKALSEGRIREVATLRGLDMSAFEACVSSSATAAAVTRDVELAARLGVRGTPTFLFGVLRDDGTVQLSQFASGAQPFDKFIPMIDRLFQTTSKS